MSTTMKTPGVYIQELDAFGNSVVPVPTAVPAFIGYTEKTSYNGKSLLNKSVKVTSLAQFLSIFGSNPPEVKYTLTGALLPERLTELQTEVDGTAATLAAANKIVTEVTDAGGEATDEQTAAVTKATEENTEAQTNLEAAKTNDNIKVLLEAQATIDGLTEGNEPSDGQLKALGDAQSTFANEIKNADFVDHGYAYSLAQKSINFRLYSAMKFFYENGGSACFVMTIGGYNYDNASIKDTTAFTDAITLLEKEQEPTMLVIPDAVEVFDSNVTHTNTSKDKYYEQRYKNAYSLQNAMINHCGGMMSRIAILDIPGGYIPPGTSITSVQQFRTSVSPENPKFNSYAAAYYPWLNTTVYQSSEISYKNIDQGSYETLQSLLENEFTDPNTGIVLQDIQEYIAAYDPDSSKVESGKVRKADKVLQNVSKSYQLLLKGVMTQMNLIAPSAGMAGIYTSVDNNEGVWKAPANVGMQSTVSPAISIDHSQQEDLNMPINGKSICAIRAFTGRGNLVWGARTLDGNSNDWRYINVRRTMIFLEQSVKEAAKTYVFAPNDASTWTNVKSMISNFLTGVWKQGGLVGPKPASAFSVSVGLGSTMTGDDILNGIMRVSVKVAISHPAEFIEITFQQQMQEA
ncbi:MAG: phage tail sheath family protein [Flavobacteriaceae bacterium]|nr:phage tail sheath family protein [Flavobacteriaceae bacterium]